MATAVLALQGAFAEHERVLRLLGEKVVELRCARDLELPFDRLVLPGGESTVQGKLLREEGMLGPLRERVLAGMPVLATCAGLILLARRVEDAGAAGRERIRPESWLATLDVTVERNAYGRQLGSFRTAAPFDWGRADVGSVGPVRPSGPSWPDGPCEIPLTFIRAPRITRVGPGVQVLAMVDGNPVAVREGAQVGCAFHPELDGTLVHEAFLSL